MPDFGGEGFVDYGSRAVWKNLDDVPLLVSNNGGQSRGQAPCCGIDASQSRLCFLERIHCQVPRNRLKAFIPHYATATAPPNFLSQRAVRRGACFSGSTVVYLMRSMAKLELTSDRSIDRIRRW